jgi:hypothetical protein
MTLKILFLIFFALPSFASVQTDFEWGEQIGYGTQIPQFATARFYLLGKGEFKFSDLVQLNASARIWFGKDHDYSIRALSIVLNLEKAKINFGFQEIPWGETFGLYISDIVNPRDYRDPFLTEIAFTRLPVLAINAQYYADPLTFQFIVTPVPRSNLFAKRGTPYDLFGPSLSAVPSYDPPSYALDRLGQDVEFGGRVSYLFPFGLDLGLLYYRHFNRNPVYTLDAATSTLIPVVNRVQSIGLTASLSQDRWVFRADAIAHTDQPVQQINFAIPITGTVWQGIAGADYSTENGWTFGGQYHSDVTPIRTLHWGSVQVMKVIDGSFLEPKLFVFKGIGNQDLWIQPNLGFKISKRTTIQLRADLISASSTLTDGVLPIVRNLSRIFTWITFKF